MPKLEFQPQFTPKHAAFANESRRLAVENDPLVQALAANLLKVNRNHYNLEVFLALANFIGHKWRVLQAMADAERLLGAASAAAKANQAQNAVRNRVRAHAAIQAVNEEGVATFRDLTAVFEKSRFPKGQSVGGRQFVYVLDDTKDHWADRTADLGFMQAPEKSIGLDEWRKQMWQVIQDYAQAHNVNVRGAVEEQGRLQPICRTVPLIPASRRSATSPSFAAS